MIVFVYQQYRKQKYMSHQCRVSLSYQTTSVNEHFKKPAHMRNHSSRIDIMLSVKL